MSAQCLIASQLLLRKHVRISGVLDVWNLIYPGWLLFHMGTVVFRQSVWSCAVESAFVVRHKGEMLGLNQPKKKKNMI